MNGIGLLRCLNESVEKLGAIDRQAVLLRFFEQKSFVEVGASLGMSEEAARKRTDRAVMRMRDWFAYRGVSVPSENGHSAIFLAQLATSHLPSSISRLAMSAVTGAGANASNAAIAKGVINMMRVAKLKLAGFVCAIFAVTAGGAATAIVAIEGTGNSVSNASAPVVNVAANSTPASDNTSELPQLAIWDVILAKPGADAVLSVARPVTTDSKGYRAIVCDAAELRSTMMEIDRNGFLESVDHELSMMREMLPGSATLTHDGGFVFNFPSTSGVMILGQFERTEDTFQRVANSKLKVKLNYPAVNADINERVGTGMAVGRAS